MNHDEIAVMAGTGFIQTNPAAPATNATAAAFGQPAPATNATAAAFGQPAPATNATAQAFG